jgi:hypothetical protein
MSAGVLAVPMGILYREMQLVEQVGVESAGWRISESTSIEGVGNNSSVVISTNENSIIAIQNANCDLKTDNKWIQENIIDVYKHVGFKVLDQVKKDGKVTSGLVWLEKEFYGFKVRIPFDLDFLRKDFQ